MLTLQLRSTMLTQLLFTGMVTTSLKTFYPFTGISMLLELRPMEQVLDKLLTLIGDQT